MWSREPCDSTCWRSACLTELVSGKAGLRTQASQIPKARIFSQGSPYCSSPDWVPPLALYLNHCVTLGRSLPSLHRWVREETKGLSGLTSAYCSSVLELFACWNFIFSKVFECFTLNKELEIRDMLSLDGQGQQGWEWTWQPCGKGCILIILGRAFGMKNRHSSMAVTEAPNLEA